METISITGSEFERQYFPCGGFLLLSKDLPPKKVGMIHTPDSVRDDHARFMSTGLVVAKAIFKEFETSYDHYFMDKIRNGDRVGFGTSVPLYSPSPSFYQFSGDDKEKYVTLHVRDVLCVICDTEEKKIEFAERFQE